MKVNKENLLELISSMSLIEIIELIESIEKKFGICASDYNNESSVQVTNDIQNKTEFDLYLNSIGNNKISVIKIIRNFLNLGLKDAKDLVESCPVLIKEKINKKDLDELKKSLEEVGASVEIK